MSLTASIYQRLASDSTLTSLLASYKGNPAIFTVDPAPSDANLPYLVTEGNVLDTTQITQNTKQRTATHTVRDIKIYTEATGTSKPIETIAERVWELFDRQALTIDGWTSVVVRADRPILGPTGDASSYGRVVTLDLILQQNS